MKDERDHTLEKAQEIIDAFVQACSDESYSVPIMVFAITILLEGVLEQSENPDKVLTVFLVHLLNGRLEKLGKKHDN